MSAGMLLPVKPSGRVLRFCRNLSSPLLSSQLQAEIEEFLSPEVYRLPITRMPGKMPRPSAGNVFGQLMSL